MTKKGHKRNKMPERCVICDFLLRKAGTTAKQHPGTRLHGGKGVCSTCRNRIRKARLRKENTERKPRTDAFKSTENLGELRQYVLNRRARLNNAPRATEIKIAGRRAA